MPVVAPLLNAVVEVLHVCTEFGQNSINVSHWLVSAIVNLGARYQAIADQMDAQFETEFKNCLCADATYRGVIVRGITAPMSAQYFANTNVGGGAGGAEPESTQTCALFTLQSGLGGRRNRGRKYIPFLSEDDVTGTGVLSAPYLVNLATLATLFSSQRTIVDGADQSTLTPVIWHRDLGTATPITGYRTNQYPATQRRRSLLRPDGPPPV